MTDTMPASRARLHRLIGAVALVFLSAFVVIDHERLSHTMALQRSNAQPGQFMQLESQLSQLQTSLAAERPPPATVSQSVFGAAEKAQNDRLARIEQSLTDRAGSADLSALASKVTVIEGELWRLRHPAPPRVRQLVEDATPRALPIAEEPPPVTPPFTVLGAELRGNEAFLTLAASGAQTLSQVRVLRVGEAEGDWRLKTLDQHTAVFEIAGHLQRLPVP